jgi:hypothetical protein
MLQKLHTFDMMLSGVVIDYLRMSKKMSEPQINADFLISLIEKRIAPFRNEN